VVLLVCLVLWASARGIGLEKKWGDAIGTAHSARLLSHADGTLAGPEKTEIHAFFAKHNRPIPAAEDESADAQSQQIRITRVKWLITVSRPEAGPSLLLKENITYGFWRNLRALKWPALAIALAVLVGDAYGLYRAGSTDPRFAEAIALAVLCGVIILFLALAATRARVIEASLGYARHLFSLRNDPAVVARAEAHPAAQPAAQATP
jgi:hypothetical protein